MENNITNLIQLLSLNPTNAELNFKIAKEYEDIGQLATAISFYLKCAEFNIEKNKTLAYFSLLRAGDCFQKQGQRDYSVSNSYLQAIQLMPHRPEAYLYLSRFHERLGHWQECYTFAEIGLMFSKDIEASKLVDYPGRFALVFQKAISGWHIGRQDETKTLLLEVAATKNLPEHYWISIINNFNMLNIALDKIAIVLPVRDGGTGRAKRLLKCITSWENVSEGLSDMHIIIDEDDVHHFGDLEEYKKKVSIYIKPSGLTLMQKINTIGMSLAEMYKYICFIGDDIVFQTQWESKFINYLKDVPAGLVYANTLDNPDSVDWATHPCITSNLVKAVGFYGCPAVHHNYFDNYWSEICKEIGYFQYMPEVVMDHRRKESDKDYLFWSIVDLQEKDRVRYNEYKQSSFNEDLIKIREKIQGL
jgi:tetratricopeptide (TPR) repeat protein